MAAREVTTDLNAALGPKGNNSLRIRNKVDSGGPVKPNTKKCPLCLEKMLPGQPTRFICIKYTTYTQPTKVHAPCAETYDGGVIEE